MIFSSLEFIFIFLPIFLGIYRLLPSTRRNLLIFVSSILFYGVGLAQTARSLPVEKQANFLRLIPVYVLLFLAIILFNFIFGMLIFHNEGKNRKKLLHIGVVVNAVILIFFKYTSFILRCIGLIFHFSAETMDLPAFHIAVPMGMSFYIFQSIAYLVDIYRKETRPANSLIKFGSYMSMFPQLTQGPIMNYENVRQQIRRRGFSMPMLSEGLKMFIFGLGIKVLLANRVHHLWTNAGNFGYDAISTPLAWLAIAGQSFYLYFDWLGYSLMAVGLGIILGISIPENFNHPYISLTMQEFWRRWHITLGNWFKNYIYIPLGGSKNGTLLTYRNMFIVWMFTAIWHGANFNFILWGLFLFACMAIERAFLGDILRGFPVLGHIYMIILIPINWVFFSITDLPSMGIFFKKLFPFLGKVGSASGKDFASYVTPYWILLLLLCVLFSTKIPFIVYKKIKDTLFGHIFLIFIFLFSVYSIYMGLNDTFAYGGF